MYRNYHVVNQVTIPFLITDLRTWNLTITTLHIRRTQAWWLWRQTTCDQ